MGLVVVNTDEIPEVSDDVVADFNKGMAKIARLSKREDLTPLTFQLSTTWERGADLGVVRSNPLNLT